MALVNIVFTSAGPEASYGLMPVYNGRYSASETYNSTGTSQASDITALGKQVARVKVSGGAIWLSAPAAAPAAALDYVKDVAPRFTLLVAKDRPAAIALMRSYKADAKKLEEAMLTPGGKHHQGNMAEALARINELLGG